MKAIKESKSTSTPEQDFLSQKNKTGQHPSVRLRRLRSAGWVRDMVAEYNITNNDVIWPLFITEGKGNRETVNSMPGVERLSIDLIIEELKPAIDLGLKATAIFPVVPAEKKTMDGSEALNPDNLINRAVSEIKAAHPDLGIITDVALDPYTTHGHDGVVDNGKVLNDETVDILTQQALLQAKAGADVVAPSDMMDGRIGAIRDTLESAKFENTMILSYAAKYASCFYGPFRDAVNSGDFLKGDKKTYQMDPANRDECMREVALDVAEGADMVMVKPGIPYLDIVRAVKDNFNIPVFAYHVSGEFAMLKAAAQNGWLDYDAALMETLLSFKRAGTSGIFTYGAYDCLKFLDKVAKNKATP